MSNRVAGHLPADLFIRIPGSDEPTLIGNVMLPIRTLNSIGNTVYGLDVDLNKFANDVAAIFGQSAEKEEG